LLIVPARPPLEVNVPPALVAAFRPPAPSLPGAVSLDEAPQPDPKSVTNAAKPKRAPVNRADETRPTHDDVSDLACSKFILNRTARGAQSKAQIRAFFPIRVTRWVH
jgi:hypothetical protein